MSQKFKRTEKNEVKTFHFGIWNVSKCSLFYAAAAAHYAHVCATDDGLKFVYIRTFEIRKKMMKTGKFFRNEQQHIVKNVLSFIRLVFCVFICNKLTCKMFNNHPKIQI